MQQRFQLSCFVLLQLEIIFFKYKVKQSVFLCYIVARIYEQVSVQDFYVCLGEYVSLFVVIFLSMFHCVFVSIVAFLLSCFVILFVHAFILSEKRSEPVRTHWESLVHTHTGQGLPIIILRPHRWLPPQQMTSAAEESSCLPIDTFNHRSLTEGPSF